MRSYKRKSESKKWKYLRKRLRESWQWYLLLLPALIYLIIFNYGPMYGVQIAFKDFRASKGIWDSAWVGLKYFERFLSNPNFWKLIRNTLAITLYDLCLFPVPIIFALLLNEISHAKLKKTVQMITYMPHFLSEVVVCSLVLLLLDRTNGPVNNMIDFLGGTRRSFIGIPEAFTSIYTLSGLWQNMGWNAVLYISALASISTEEVEAAKIDGASRLQVIRYVNLPGILPTIVITFLMRVGRIMSLGYSKIFLLQNDLNLDKSNVISTYVYEIGLVGAQYSYSTAIGLFNNVVNIIELLSVNKITSKITGSGLF